MVVYPVLSLLCKRFLKDFALIFSVGSFSALHIVSDFLSFEGSIFDSSDHVPDRDVAHLVPLPTDCDPLGSLPYKQCKV